MLTLYNFWARITIVVVVVVVVVVIGSKTTRLPLVVLNPDKTLLLVL